MIVQRVFRDRVSLPLSLCCLLFFFFLNKGGTNRADAPATNNMPHSTESETAMEVDGSEQLQSSSSSTMSAQAPSTSSSTGSPPSTSLLSSPDNEQRPSLGASAQPVLHQSGEK